MGRHSWRRNQSGKGSNRGGGGEAEASNRGGGDAWECGSSSASGGERGSGDALQPHPPAHPPPHWRSGSADKEPDEDPAKAAKAIRLKDKLIRGGGGAGGG